MSIGTSANILSVHTGVYVCVDACLQCMYVKYVLIQSQLECTGGYICRFLRMCACRKSLKKNYLVLFTILRSESG